MTLPDNSVKLEVPAGAVPANTMITITTTDGAAPQGITAASPILQFEPDGTVFAKPVTVTFTFKNATSPVVFWSNSAGGYDLIEGTVTGSTIAAPVTHFSKGFVAERPAGASATCGTSVACAAGATCGYGGPATNSDGHNASLDGGAGSKTTGPTVGNGGSGAVSVDASAPSSGGSTDPGSRQPMTGALSAPPSGMCCSCGSDGVFQCSTCAGNVDPGTSTLRRRRCLLAAGNRLLHEQRRRQRRHDRRQRHDHGPATGRPRRGRAGPQRRCLGHQPQLDAAAER